MADDFSSFFEQSKKKEGDDFSSFFDSAKGGGPKKEKEQPVYMGMDAIGQAVDIEPTKEALRQKQKQQLETGKGFVSGLGQGVLGAVELIPGLGSYAAKKEKELQSYGDPTAQKIGVGTVMAAPIPLGKQKALAEGLGFLGKTYEGLKTGGKAGLFGGLIAPTYEEDKSRYFDKAFQAAAGGVVGGALGAGISGVPAAYGATKDYLRKLLGRDASEAEAKLIQEAIAAGKDVQTRLSKEQKDAIAALQKEVDRSAAATAAGEKAGAKAGEALAGPTAKTEEYLGEFAKAPQTMDQIGTFIRDRVNSFVGNIKKQRNINANKDFKEAFDAASVKEGSGNLFMNSPEMGSLRKFIDDKLSVETDATLRSQLTQIRKSLFGGGQARSFSPAEIEAEIARQPKAFSYEAKRRAAIDALNKKEIETGVTPSFQSSETIRRKVGDAAFGVPEEGYAAIGQNLSKELYGKLSDAMKAYEPSFAKYLDNYKRLSENIETAGTKLGKSLVGVEKDAPGYFSVPAGNLPDKAFSSPENVRILIEAMGGNKEPVLAAAERYIANKISEKGTLEGARAFLNKDTSKSLLKELGPEFERRIKDKYLAEATAMTGRKQALEQTVKQADDKIKNINKGLESIRARTTKLDEGLASIDAALTRDLKVQEARNLVSQLQKELPPQDVARLKVLVDEYAEASSAKNQAISTLGKVVGYGIPGGAATYYGGKYVTQKAFGED
jgi:hypothetical protein